MAEPCGPKRSELSSPSRARTLRSNAPSPSLARTFRRSWRQAGEFLRTDSKLHVVETNCRGPVTMPPCHHATMRPASQPPATRQPATSQPAASHQAARQPLASRQPPSHPATVPPLQPGRFALQWARKRKFFFKGG